MYTRSLVICVNYWRNLFYHAVRRTSAEMEHLHIYHCDVKAYLDEQL